MEQQQRRPMLRWTSVVVALVAGIGWWWQLRDERADDERKLAAAQQADETVPQARPSARVTAEPPPASAVAEIDRRGRDLPAAQAWRGGDIDGRQWPPLRPQTAWLVVAADSGEEADAVLPLLTGVWRHRDLGAVVLAAAPTPSDGDRDLARSRAAQRLRDVMATLTTDGQMVVLLGSGVQGEAALQLLDDPRVLAVAALEPQATAQGLGQELLQRGGRKKRAWLGGSAGSANAIDSLDRDLPHATVATGQRGAGLRWLGDADQRAALGGWLHSALGPAR